MTISDARFEQLLQEIKEAADNVDLEDAKRFQAGLPKFVSSGTIATVLPQRTKRRRRGAGSACSTPR